MSANPNREFRALHQQPAMFLLPNAWDAASAQLLARTGARAVATSSAALCWSLGYPDGSALPVEELTAAVRRITRNLPIPLSVDVEDGYRAAPGEVADLVDEIRKAGAAGINIEDGTGPSALLAEKIAAIRSRAAGADLFINARTDVYLRSLAQGEAAVAMVIERARAYADAGADGLFVPGQASTDAAARIAAATSLSLNLMVVPGLPATEELRHAGVRRLSVGPRMFLSAYGRLRDDAAAFLGGNHQAFSETTLTFAEMDGQFRS